MYMKTYNMSHKLDPDSKRLYWLTDGLEVDMGLEFFTFEKIQEERRCAEESTCGHWWYEGGNLTPAQALKALRDADATKAVPYCEAC